MSWIHRYWLRHYLIDTIWIAPFVGMLAAMFIARGVHAMDDLMAWRSALNPEAAKTVLITLGSAMFTFVVFVSSALLIAVQLASVSLTPRIIALVFQDRLTKIAMTLFMFTFTLSVAVVLRIGDHVPAFTVRLTAYSCVISLAVFLILIDHLGKLLRPSTAVRRVAMMGRRVIKTVYPYSLSQRRRSSAEPASWSKDAQSSSVLSCWNFAPGEATRTLFAVWPIVRAQRKSVHSRRC